MNEWGGINDEYELTDWETEDVDWIRESVGGKRARLAIDPIEADALMENALAGYPLTTEQVRASVEGRAQEIRFGHY